MNSRNVKVAYLFICIGTLRDGGFSFHKWCINSKELSELIIADQQKHFSSESPDEFILNNFEPKKALGVSWDTISDKFVFSFKEIIDYALTLPKTRRSLMGAGAKLGILCPITIFWIILILNGTVYYC